MAATTRILMIEDDPQDAELAEREMLHGSGLGRRAEHPQGLTHGTHSRDR